MKRTPEETKAMTAPEVQKATAGGGFGTVKPQEPAKETEKADEEDGA